MWFVAVVVVIVAALRGSHEAFAVWIYRASAIMRVAVAVLTAMTEAALPSSARSVPIKKGAPVPCEDRGSFHTLLEGVNPLVT